MRPDEVTEDDSSAEVAQDQLVPGWLALLVLVLLLAVVGLGGFIVRGLVTGEHPRNPQDSAVLTARAAAAKQPGNVDALRELAFAYQQAKRYDQALSTYDRVLKLAPKDSASLYNKGVIYLALNVDDKAEETLWDVLENEPTHVLAAKALGDYYASKGQYRSVLVAVRPVVKAKPDMADLQYLMGLAYEHTGHPAWAKARYKLALRYVPDYKQARDGLARLGAGK